MSSASIKLKFSDRQLEMIRQALTDKYFSEEKFRPMVLVDDAPEAGFVEFGTGPSSKWKNGYRAEKKYDPIAGYKMSDVELKFHIWARNRFGSGAEAEEIGRRVYHKVMEEGMPPQPFIRPAVYNVLRDPDLAKILFYEGTPGMAERMKEEAKRILLDGGHNGTAMGSEASPIVTGLRVAEVGESSAGLEIGKRGKNLWIHGSGEYDWPDMKGEYRAKHYGSR